MLKPQDIFVLLKLVTMGKLSWSYANLAVSLKMSPSQLHSAIKRALLSRLAIRKAERILPQMKNLEEFLVHGIQYAFPVEPAGVTRGMPTSHAAPPLCKKLVLSSSELPPVWPDPMGEVKGTAITPLFKSAPIVSRTNPELYELLALTDALRSGRVRERKLAINHLRKRMNAM